MGFFFIFVFITFNPKVMNTKLTLTIEKEIIKRAKDYAKEKNRSLSDIIENYLKVLTKEEQKLKDKKLNPIVNSLKGSFNMPKNMDYKKELKTRLEEKYL
ncbi:DUF6364 family protein [soil metagenome]